MIYESLIDPDWFNMYKPAIRR